VIARIKAIVMSKNEAELVDYLSGEAAQTLIDAVHEVCCRIFLGFPRPRLTTLSSPVTTSISIHDSETNKTVDLSGLPPQLRRKCLSALCRICGRRALLPDEAPNIDFVDPEAPAQNNLSGHSIVSEQVVTRVKAIIMRDDEAKLADYPSGEVAQTLIDMIHEVCLHVK
jgi:hypothetical protein